jgi:hypothetical protein
MVLQLDDFRTGETTIELPSPPPGQVTVRRFFQRGTMLGGGRLVLLHVAPAPNGSSARLTIGGGRLDLALERGQAARLELFYGLEEDSSPSGLLINLQRDRADRVRTQIADAEPPVINFNLQLKTPAGLFTAAGNLAPGAIDFHFEDFTGPGGTDFTAVDLIAFIFQVNGSMGLAGIDTAARGGLLGDARAGVWLRQFGRITDGGAKALVVTPDSPVGVGPLFHAEAHHTTVLGADFVYSARITADWQAPDLLAADLQFRMSDEGRYGVRVSGGRISLYRFMLPDLPCDRDPAVLAPCPLWPHMNLGFDVDLPTEYELGHATFDASLPTIGVTVVAAGSHFVVAFDAGPIALGRFEADDPHLGVGRFGVYVLASSTARSVRFDDLAATTDPAAPGNFTLLYSVAGYDANGPKRALVRTLNDLDAREYHAAGSSFTLRNGSGEVMVGRLTPDRVLGPGERLPRTFGMQLLAADFSHVTAPGTYTLEVRVVTSDGVRELRSAPFEIRSGLVTDTMLWPLTVLNAEMRSAADDDFRRNWRIESGAGVWSVGVDGAFLADRADDRVGAVLRRRHNMDNAPLEVVDFRLVGSIAILAGCDAQLQFRITPTERWGVTLQAGAAGGCPHHTGAAALRLHREGIGPDGQHHFEAIESHPVPAFELGRPYDVEIRALRQSIQVVLGDTVLIDREVTGTPLAGGFALKAWGSTVRFDHVKVWARDVALSHPRPGVWIPYHRSSGLSSQGFPIRKVDTDPPQPTTGDPRRPFAAQQHGFHDCNSVMGEITSHGVFLSALVDVWSTRAHAAQPVQRERLRAAIVRAVVYFGELYEEADRSGDFAHQEPGRAALAISNRLLTALFAMYGLSSFADRGSVVEPQLARDAYDRVEAVFARHGGRDHFVDSIVAVRMARAAARLGRPVEQWLERARHAAAGILNLFDRQPDAIGVGPRLTHRSIPWFEGLFEMVARGHVTLTAAQHGQLTRIARQLTAVMNDPANGFCVMPQGQDNRNPPSATLPIRNWLNMADVPLSVYPLPEPPAGAVGDLYVTTGCAAAAADCVYLGRLANLPELQRLAVGNLHWISGLNPGVPSTKIATLAPPQAPWSVASFVYRGPDPFVRTMEGHRTQESATKSTRALWERSSGDRRRETWGFDPQNNGYLTITNGHVIREGQWHNWTVGVGGWVCGETFMLTDAVFLKAALALEDWYAGSMAVVESPYDASRPHVVDSTHLDRVGTGWPLDDPDRASYAQAHRMATGLAAGKGLGGGRLTGHRIGERIGVLCLPRVGTTFVDVDDREIAATSFGFADINSAPWAQIARAATEIARARGFGAGIFTGHQLKNRCGWIGIDAALVSIFDIDNRAVEESEWHFLDVNAVPWAQAARVATEVCIARGFAGGFFTGHQLPNRRQIAAIRLASLA